MDIKNTVLLNFFPLGGTENVDETTETPNNLNLTVQSSVRSDSGVDAEEEHVVNSVPRGEIRGRVGIVLVEIDDTALIQNAGDIVAFAESVIRLVRVDRKMRSALGVGIVWRC